MSYTDVNGNEFLSFEDACRYYGADTPAQIEAEEAYYAAEEQAQREMTDALLFDTPAQLETEYAYLAEGEFAQREMTDALLFSVVPITDEIPF